MCSLLILAKLFFVVVIAMWNICTAKRFQGRSKKFESEKGKVDMMYCYIPEPNIYVKFLFIKPKPS